MEAVLEKCNTVVGRCWAVVVHGLELGFYEYHENLPVKGRLVLWDMAAQLTRNAFHVRNDSLVMDGMLRYMTQQTPDPR